MNSSFKITASIFILWVISIPAQELPLPYSPGNTFQPGSIIDRLPDFFIWSKDPSADGYAYYISIQNIDGEFDLIFSSEKNGLIKDTIVRPSNIFQKGNFYRWNIRSKRGNEWSPYSPRSYFYIKDESLDPPFLFYPSANSFGNRIIYTKDPQFSWSRTAAQNYEFSLSRKNSEGNYEPIFSSITQDTFITIPDSLIDFGNQYRWNVRSKKANNYSRYSPRAYFRVLYSDVLSALSGRFPGTNFYPGEKIKLPLVSFNWNNVPASDGFGLYISRLNNFGNYELIFSSEGEGLIKDTAFTISPELLIPENYYRWNMRARVGEAWSDYSNRLYFNTSFEKNYPPEPLSPGSLNNAQTIFNDSPSFVWRDSTAAEIYSIKIYETETPDNIVYDTERKVDINSMQIKIPSGILKTNIIYSWQIKRFSESGWSDYSQPINFVIKEKENGNNILESSDIPQEIILLFKYAGLINTPIAAYFYKDRIYLPFNEVTGLLEIKNNLDKKEEIITGTIINEGDFYEYNFKTKSFKRGEKNIIINNDDFIAEDFEYFVSLDLMRRSLGLEFSVDIRNLVITLSNAENTPLYLRYLRENNYKSLQQKQFEENYPLIKNRQKSLLSGGMLDYYLSTSFAEKVKPFSSYQLGMGGELLGGSAEVLTRGTYFENKLFSNETEYLWRYDFEKNNYVSQFLFGNFSVEGLIPYPVEGVQVTNEPLEPRKVYGGLTLFDKTYPNYTVELYINNQLIDYTKSDASGRFKFSLPLLYGTTLVQLKFYGPAGEYYSDKRLYQIPYVLIPEGEFNYKFSLGKFGITKNNMLQAQAYAGITDWLTTKVAVDYINTPFFNKPIFFSSTTARIETNYLLNLLAAPEAFYRISTAATFYSQSSFGLSYTSYKNNALINPSRIKDEINSSIFYPINIDEMLLNIQLTGRYFSFDRFKRYDIELGTSVNYNNFNPFINYELFLTEGSGNTSRQAIAAGFLLSVPSFLKFFNGNILNSRLSYSTTTAKFDNLSLSFSTSVFNTGRIQISHTRNFINSISNTQFQFIMEFPFMRTYTSASDNAFSQSIQGSIGYDQHFNSLSFFNRSQIGRASASLRFFIDENNDETYSDGEELVENIRLKIGAAGTPVNDKDKIVRVHELNPYFTYNTEIDETSIKNPALLPEYKKFSFVAAPNIFNKIDIPFYSAGELDGIVLKPAGNSQTAVSGIKVHLIGVDNDFKKTLTTFSDGSFYYFGLPPGSYSLEVDQKQLEQIGLLPDRNRIQFDYKSGEIIKSVTFNLKKSN